VHHLASNSSRSGKGLSRIRSLNYCLIGWSHRSRVSHRDYRDRGHLGNLWIGIFLQPQHICRADGARENVQHSKNSWKKRSHRWWSTLNSSHNLHELSIGKLNSQLIVLHAMFHEHKRRYHWHIACSNLFSSRSRSLSHETLKARLHIKFQYFNLVFLPAETVEMNRMRDGAPCVFSGLTM